MPRLTPAELFNLSDDEYIVANEGIEPNSFLGSDTDSDTLKGDGDEPVAANQGEGDDPTASDANDAKDIPDSTDGESDADADDDEAKTDQNLDVPDEEFDPEAKKADKVPEKGKPVGTDAAKAADVPVKAADGSTPPKGGDPVSGEKPGETPAVPLSTEQLQAFYAQVMKPFKANNKEFSVRTPEEAIRLMQMGAGYGKKLSDMQPHLKALRILEKHGLLDENKLSFLVDVNAKNPEAIKQLLRDAKIDPLDLNMEEGSDYKAPNHSVPDAEVAFREVLADVRAAPNGPETIRHVNESWDEPSKARLWKNPEILRVIQTQRENGIYDQIVSELERQKLFGTIKPDVPFIEAYRIAGDSLVKAAGLDPTSGQQAEVQKTSTPANPVSLGTKTAKPRTPVSNDAKARAAASSTNKAAKVVKPVDMLDMSDDDFMKHFGPKF